MLPGNYQELTLDEKRAVLLECLKQDCEITFIKVDGSLREMPCTLRPEALPKLVTESKLTSRPSSPTTLSVWCLDKQEWRSFKIENVTSVKSLTYIEP